MLSLEITGSKELADRLNAGPDDIRRALRNKVTALTLKLEAKVKVDKLSGQVLHARTGALRRAVASRVEEIGAQIIGTVYVSNDVKYAHIHEYGGRTLPHDIVPVKAKALAFMMSGKQVFAKRVHHPGSVMPERSYLRSSLDDMRDEIIAGVKNTLDEVTR
jgi:phage gpG-like protein